MLVDLTNAESIREIKQNLKLLQNNNQLNWCIMVGDLTQINDTKQR